MTSEVAFATAGDRAVVVKRCASPIYLDWLREEQRVLRALAGSGLPIPACIGYAEAETKGPTVGWLLVSRLAGNPLLRVLEDSSERTREVLLRNLGRLVCRLHATPVPQGLAGRGDWTARQLAQARANLPWCDGTPAGLAQLEQTQPPRVPERLIHGDLALDNVLVDERGAMSLIDWAGGGSGDPRLDIALALQTEPEVELTATALEAFYAEYGSPALDRDTRDWFVRLYDFF